MERRQYKGGTQEAGKSQLWELVTRTVPFGNMMGFQIAIEVGSHGLRPPLPTAVRLRCVRVPLAPLSHTFETRDNRSVPNPSCSS